MSSTEPDRPLGGHEYEIVFGRLERSREVDVRSNSARPLKVGETYTFGRAEGFYDVIVAAVAMAEGGGWSACCKVIDLQRI
jgi:hypothetical protein